MGRLEALRCALTLPLLWAGTSCSEPASQRDPTGSMATAGSLNGAGGGAGSLGGLGGGAGSSTAGHAGSPGASGGGAGGGAAGAAIGGMPGASGSSVGGAGTPSSGGAESVGGTLGASAGTMMGGAPSRAGSGGTAAGSTGSGGRSGGESGAGGSAPTRPARVLLYSFSTLDIESVPEQLDILAAKLEEWQYEVDRSEDPSVFNDQNLERYAAVGMINTCFWPFGANQQGAAQSEALETFLEDGGGLFGTHCADVTFQGQNPPALYNRLIGGRASSQNFDGDSDCEKAAEHPTTAELPAAFVYSGNLDATDFIAPDSQVLVKCRWGDTNRTEVAVSWVRMQGAGRVFYTNFAKVDLDLTHPTIGEPHIARGLGWVLGR
jgi:type 1 glutamine amidotransferase